jgi:PAS domain S-box-containing protein
MGQGFEQLVLAHNPDAVVIVDDAGRVLHWSAAAEALFGHTAPEAQGRALESLILAPEQAGEIVASLQRARATGSAAEESVRCRKDGSRMHVGSAISVVPGEAGRAPGFLLALRDVTALKVGRETRLVEARWRELLDSTPDAILIVNVTGRIVLANEQAQQVFGHAPGELIGQPVEALLPQRYRHQHVARRSAFYEQPRKRSMGAGLELFGLRLGGEEFPVEISLGPLQTEEGPMVMCAVRDITERQEARRKSDRQFRDLLESAPDAMVIVDESGAMVRVNSQTVQLFGHPREALLGQPVEMLVPERFRGQHGGHRAGFFRAPKPRQMGAGLELYGLRRDGSEFPVEISLSPIQTEDGLLIAGAIRDASERRHAERLLQEANRLKSEFLANMSHELRTPLNGILGFSELLVDRRVGPLNDKQREYIQDIHACGQHLLQLINDVLDLSKVEAGRMDVYAEAFEPAAAVASVLAVIAPLAQKKQVRLMPPECAVPQVMLDPHKFRQVLFNLLSNAVKFTEPGGHVQLSVQPEGEGRLRMEVRDTGIGIAPADMPRLFQAFGQLDSGLSRRAEGTGLGLALTRRLVELQGGSIEVQSTPGVGSTFSVLLPVVGVPE